MPTRSDDTCITPELAIAAVEALEAGGERWLDDAGANADAAAAPEHRRLSVRAAHLAREHGLRTALGRAARLPGWIALALVGAGLLLGIGAAWAGVATGGGPAAREAAGLNVVWFLTATLGLHTLLLALGLAATAAGLLHRSAGPVAALARAIGARLGGGRGSTAAAAIAAGAAARFRGRRGVVRAAMLGNAGGLAFAIGATLALVVGLAARDHYLFFWKTTLLEDQRVAEAVDAVAAGPRVIGLPVPTRREITAARWTPARAGALDEDAQLARRWAVLMVGSLLVWAVAPRLLLLGVGAAALRLMPAGTPCGEAYRQRVLSRIDAAQRPGPSEASDRSRSGRFRDLPGPIADDRPRGASIVLGYEIDDARWPPVGLHGVIDLGVIDGAVQRARVLDRLDAEATVPRNLVMFVSRGEVSARADRAFLAELTRRLGDRLALALDLPASMSHARGNGSAGAADDRIATRGRHWRAAAAECGVHRVIDVDLGHFTARSRAVVQRLIDAGPPAPGPSRPTPAFERAGDDIQRWALSPHDDPDAALAQLIAKIDRHFGVGGERVPAMRDPIAGGVEHARETGRKLAAKLPSWLPNHPRWMAAASLTATAGTLGSIAAVGGPIGVAAGFWPLYAAAGAALGETLGRSRSGKQKPPPPAGGDRVRAALLHALILELQGLPDERIAEALDAVLADMPMSGAEAMTAHAVKRLNELERMGRLRHEVLA